MDRIAERIARVRAMFRGVFRRAALEREMREEFRHHVAARTEHLVRDGMTPEDAANRAQREFGHQGTHAEEARGPLGLESFSQVRFSWLDMKLAFRLLPRYPVVNLAAIFALAVGIPVGLAPSHLARALEAPLPGDDTAPVRAVRFWDPASSGVAPMWDSDFRHWAQSLRSFSLLGALRTATWNVSAADDRATPVAGAQLSASIFPMLGARPLLGRALEDSDVAPGAEDVVVISHGLWSAHFGQDRSVVGRTLRIGRTPHVIVGVMPEGFTFPASENIWLPLRLLPPGGNTRLRVQVLGRLADGVTAEQAQAELSAVTPPAPAMATAEEVADRARLRAEVVPFGLVSLNLPSGGLESLPEFFYVRALMLALLLVACGNVAMLVFARTATRLNELAIRMAIGASRGRIISQIFIETLVLAVVAAGCGVLAFDWMLGHVNLAGLAGLSALPYWLSLGITRTTMISAVALAALSATVAGLVPAVLITRRNLAQNVRGGSRMRFGKATGALVVADIAVSVAAVGVALSVMGHATNLDAADRATGIKAAEYLAVEFRLPERAVTGSAATRAEGAHATTAELAVAQRALIEALVREPGVRSVGIADALPRMEHRSRPYELDGIDRAANAALRWTRVARIDVGYFGALRTPILSGRDFVATDTASAVRKAIVSRAFVARALGNADPIGRRVRFPAGGDEQWYEIIGVVGPLGVSVLNPERGEAVYLPAGAGSLNPMQVAIHTSLPPASLTGRVREIARAVDPDLVMGTSLALSEVRPGDWYLVMGLATGLLVLVGVLIALATSGLYAMLTLAVSERTREIGIRAAIGATPRELVFGILRRSLVQIGIGAAIGLPIAARSVFELTTETGGQGSVVLSVSLALGLATAVVCLVALCSCLVPVRRILAIQASEAMRAQG